MSGSTRTGCQTLSGLSTYQLGRPEYVLQASEPQYWNLQNGAVMFTIWSNSKDDVDEKCQMRVWPWIRVSRWVGYYIT